MKQTQPIKLLQAGLLSVGLLLTASPLYAQAIYTDGHGDLGVDYTPGDTVFRPHWGLSNGAVVDGVALSGAPTVAPGVNKYLYAPEAIAIYTQSTSSVSGIVATSLGVSSGATVYRLGISAYPPNLGFAVETIGSPDQWAPPPSEWFEEGGLTISLTGFSGPGALSISQTISGFGTSIWFSSRDAEGTNMNNSWEFGIGGHQHLDWYFSQAGIYQVEFTWSGTYIGGETPIDVTGTGTFEFRVDAMPDAIPEPGTVGLLTVAGASFLLLRRRWGLFRAKERQADSVPPPMA